MPVVACWEREGAILAENLYCDAPNVDREVLKENPQYMLNVPTIMLP